MKVIDMLDRIAKGEEVPLIKYRDKILHWNKEKDRFEDKDGMNTWYEMDFSELNDEVEIIEEDKKDEEIEIYVNGKKVDITDIYEPLKQGEYIYKENGKLYVHKLKNVSFLIEEDKKIEKLIIGKDDVAWCEGNMKTDEEMVDIVLEIKDKINEIIDYINGGTNGE